MSQVEPSEASIALLTASTSWVLMEKPSKSAVDMPVFRSASLATGLAAVKRPRAVSCMSGSSFLPVMMQSGDSDGSDIDELKAQGWNFPG